MKDEIKRMALKIENGKIVCGCCGREMKMHDIAYGRGLCMDCAYHVRDLDMEDIIDAFPVRPSEVVTNEDETMTVLIYKRPTLEECGG